MSNTELKGVLFDCDGVLVDSMEANIATYQALLKKAGYAEPSREALEAVFHLPLRESVAQLAAISDKAELDRVTGLIEDPSIRATHLLKYPRGLSSVLEKLHEEYATGVVTSRIRSGLDDVLDQRNLRPYFDILVAKEDYEQPKPSPDGLLVALELLEMTADETVYIGDSHVDVEAAKAAGMLSIHLASVKHNDADLGITTFSAIPAAIGTLSDRKP